MKESLKLAIIGADSSYTPELIEGLSSYKESLPIHKIYLFDLEKQIFREYSDELVVDKSITLTKRGGGGYSTLAIGIMDAIYNDTGKWMVVNDPNNETLSFLPDEVAIKEDRNLALKALVAHPLVSEYDIAKPLLEEMLIAHKDNLPQFFGDWKC